MRSELRAVQTAIALGQPLPALEVMKLEALGIDVAAIERRHLDAVLPYVPSLNSNEV
jgi:hypothetical protein